MKVHKGLLGLLILVLFGSCHSKLNYEVVEEGLRIELSDGSLDIYPLSDNALRVKFYKGQKLTVPEFVLLGEQEVPEFEVSEISGGLRLSLRKMSLEYNTKDAVLSYYNSEGQLFLRERAGSRLVIPDTVQGEPCFFVEQSFETDSDEVILGLGQFQDGRFNLNGISRRLTQVNSQIAIPFIYSNKGYGLLWHQYGLTDYNPADNEIKLSLKDEGDAAQASLAEVTTTAGTQKISQDQSLYSASFTVPKDGKYSLFLDLGAMGNRHFVVIDGEPVIDQTNMWLPPTVGALVDLKAGEHEAQVLCKADNIPSLFWKEEDGLTTFRSPHAQKLDYVVFYGPSADEVISAYRNLSGNAPMFPRWAFGFWQCRERYTSANHLVETLKEFRRRRLPMDVIVQDWQYWGNKGWGVPEFDETNYPNPSGFISEIHDMNARLMVSIWSNPDRNSRLGQIYVANNRFVGETNWLDYFNPATREDYWNTLNDNMFSKGVDAWWMDAVEPENDALAGEQTYIGPGNFYRLTYPLMVSKSVYEGQRAVSKAKRVCILTRSAFSGQQRYGVINWSGDIGGSWEGYKRQIVAGMNFVMTGLPYWTTDIGGFFRAGHSQYTDKDYHELLLRWYQWGAFSPIFRIHGYMSETEPWKYGAEVEENMRKMLNLRYRLLPYIYSQAWQVSSEGSSMMRPLVMDFREDARAIVEPYQYMFGSSILVAPVIEAGIETMEVYLPEALGWYDFWTGKEYVGGQSVAADVPLDRLPLFVKAGSILPMGDFLQYSDEKPADLIELRIYKGADGSFRLYEDEGDSYDYESGAYATIELSWNDALNTLTISDVKGDFPGRLQSRSFKLVLVSSGKGCGIEKTEIIDNEVLYSGKEISVVLN
ncbi:MAG TPA: glycosyl hydrolase family 31 [Marinilabiliaceae bacterium]|nr:glycosyl hydrolase family 31 [Marinilabiliaceae bacterium]